MNAVNHQLLLPRKKICSLIMLKPLHQYLQLEVEEMQMSLAQSTVVSRVTATCILGGRTTTAPDTGTILTTTPVAEFETAVAIQFVNVNISF